MFFPCFRCIACGVICELTAGIHLDDESLFSTERMLSTSSFEMSADANFEPVLFNSDCRPATHVQLELQIGGDLPAALYRKFMPDFVPVPARTCPSLLQRTQQNDLVRRKITSTRPGWLRAGDASRPSALAACSAACGFDIRVAGVWNVYSDGHRGGRAGPADAVCSEKSLVCRAWVARSCCINIDVCIWQLVQRQCGRAGHPTAVAVCRLSVAFVGFFTAPAEVANVGLLEPAGGLDAPIRLPTADPQSAPDDEHPRHPVEPEPALSFACEPQSRSQRLSVEPAPAFTCACAKFKHSASAQSRTQVEARDGCQTASSACSLSGGYTPPSDNAARSCRRRHPPSNCLSTRSARTAPHTTYRSLRSKARALRASRPPPVIQRRLYHA